MMMSHRIFQTLQPGLPSVLVTVDDEGFGHAVMTWAVAATSDRVRFVADHRSRTLANLQRTGKAGLEIIGPGNVLAMIKGPARQVRERLQAAPFGMALWELTVADVKDQAWENVTVSPLTFQWVGPKAEEMRRMEAAVLAELRDAS
jgi:flavin reductase (DIM6/NTAB) family NADH-FMN oxidoreductase RutF